MLASEISRLESDAQGEETTRLEVMSLTAGWEFTTENYLCPQNDNPWNSGNLLACKTQKESWAVLAKLMGSLPNRVLWSTGFWDVWSGDSLSTSDRSGSYETGNVSSSGNVPITDLAWQATSCFCVFFASHLDLFAWLLLFCSSAKSNSYAKLLVVLN